MLDELGFAQTGGQLLCHLVSRLGMEQQVPLRRRLIAVLWDVELVDAVAVPAIETLVEINLKLFEQCAAGDRAPIATAW